jgi:hypothetical protein
MAGKSIEKMKIEFKENEEYDALFQNEGNADEIEKNERIDKNGNFETIDTDALKYSEDSIQLINPEKIEIERLDSINR